MKKGGTYSENISSHFGTKMLKRNFKIYHEKIWLPFSTKIDRYCYKYKILRVLKKLFDVHFTILGLLGICATPVDDVDCYCYICKRYYPHKYSMYTWAQRIKLVQELLRLTWRA